MMKQLIILSLVGFVACTPFQPSHNSSEELEYQLALSSHNSSEELESQLALFEADEIEIDGVMSEFHDYCYQSRDESKLFMNDALNSAALKVYNAIFKSIEQISVDAMAAGERQKELGRQLIMNNEATGQITDAASEDGVVEPMSIDGEDQVDESKGPVEYKSLAWRFFTGLSGAVSAFLKLVADETWAHIAKVKEELKGENFQVVFEEACRKITKNLEVDLREKFASAKEGLESAMTDPERKAELNSVRFENVGCVTTRRILMASRLCHGVEKLGPIFLPLLDYVIANRQS